MRTVSKHPRAHERRMNVRSSFILRLLLAVVKTTVLLADMNDFTEVNDVYKQCKYDG